MTPAQFKALWAATVAHHQAGRLQEAERGYRQVLDQTPRHFDALHMLGVVALQGGRLDEPERCIGEALAVEAKSAAAHNNLGNVHLRRGVLGAARSSFEHAIRLQPSHGDAHFNLAQTLRREGRAAEALPHLRRAASSIPRSAAVQNLLGAALREQGDLAGAVKAFEQAVRLQPANADTLANLGVALGEQGQSKRGEEVLRRALATAPDSTRVMGSLGTALARSGRSGEAIDLLRKVLARSPQAADALSNLGGALREAGQLDEAITLLRRAIAIDPAFEAARSNLAQALADRGDAEALTHLQAMRNTPSQALTATLLEGSMALGREDFVAAASAYTLAVERSPTHAEAQLGLGHASMGLGRVPQALLAYQRAVDADPQLAAARWALVMAQIDPMAGDASAVRSSRAAFAQALSQLDRWFDVARSAEGHRAVGSTQPFYLAYHAEPNKELLQPYGRLCTRLMQAWQQAQRIEERRKSRPASSDPVRVGIATAHVRDHSVWNAVLKGWIRGLDPARFDLYLYHLGAQEDAETQWAKSRVPHFVGGRRTLAQWATTIAGHQLDVLIYPEIGMHALTTRLASLRLAPLQAASWGHPQTTGLPTIDAYLSAEALEPPGADAHYGERLVRLASLGVALEPSRVRRVAPDLATFGLPDNAPLLLCPGLPFKYQPQHDGVWAEVARRLPMARLVFFRSATGELSDRLAARLKARFQSEGLAFEEHVVFVPFLDRPRFFGLLQRATLYLDTIGFSGFNTALQALECGLPVVTVEGEFMRGRLAAALLRRIGMDELVARDAREFVDVVVRLVGDESGRSRLRAAMSERTSALFDDPRPLADLASFLLGAGASPPSGR